MTSTFRISTNNVHYRIEIMAESADRTFNPWIDVYHAMNHWTPIDKVEVFDRFQCYYEDLLECREALDKLIEVEHSLQDWRPVFEEFCDEHQAPVATLPLSSR